MHERLYIVASIIHTHTVAQYCVLVFGFWSQINRYLKAEIQVCRSDTMECSISNTFTFLRTCLRVATFEATLFIRRSFSDSNNSSEKRSMVYWTYYIWILDDSYASVDRKPLPFSCGEKDWPAAVLRVVPLENKPQNTYCVGDITLVSRTNRQWYTYHNRSNIEPASVRMPSFITPRLYTTT